MKGGDQPDLNNFAPDSYRDDNPHSEIENKSDPDSYRDKYSKSEISNM